MSNQIMSAQLTNCKESLDSLGYRWAEGLSLDEVYQEVQGGLPIPPYDHDSRMERERIDINFLLTLGVNPKDHGYAWWREDSECKYWENIASLDKL